ncbi:MAG: hypothetical protein GQ529_08685 [Methyloprofundus sp.]|nr:hypothetical protein [Methyloprofundus sp.]
MMTTSPLPLLKQKKQAGIATSIFIALIYGVFLILAVDWMHTYEFDSDEGYNVIKALMLEDGFKLYNEILSDQPPVFTYILWLTFKVFGWNVNIGRMLVIAFVSLMVFGIYDSVRRIYGYPVALGAVLFLVLSNKFTQVSVSIMLGQPSLAMVVMSGWALTVWFTQRRTTFLLISAIFMGLSVSIKMYTLFICPISLLCIILFGENLPYRKTQKLFINQVSLWLAAITLSCLFFLLPALLSNDPMQLITSHSTTLQEGKYTLGKALWKFIVNDWGLFFMSIIGLIYAIKNRNPVGVFFGLWFAFALVILFFHYPVWYHHAFLLLIPASVMASLSVHWLTPILTKMGLSKRKTDMVGLIAIVLIAFSPLLINEKRAKHIIYPREYSKNRADQKATRIINYYAGPEHTMVTSRHMMAFRTKSSVPPSLAVTSVKRYRAGLWSAESVIEEIEKGNIELVVLNRRWKQLVRIIKGSIQEKYIRVYSDRRNRKLEIFVRKDIVAKKLPLQKK